MHLILTQWGCGQGLESAAISSCDLRTEETVASSYVASELLQTDFRQCLAQPPRCEAASAVPEFFVAVVLRAAQELS